tara:strand:+ start:29648 stop:30580 length:933 start_codon:yes stop_codon:yes gene_type:complete
VTEDVRELQEGEVLIENLYLSFDPTQRTWLNDLPGYLPPVQIGEVIRSGGIGRVIQSKNSQYNVNDLTFGFVGWQTHCITKPTDEDRFRVVPDVLPIPTMLNILGITGITAYYGLLELGKPKPGETVLVSGAAGATGSVAAQIAKLKDCHVIGIAGGEEKCAWLKECGIDDVIDYKNTNVHEELPKIAKNGIDVYFDNVGGDLLETVLFLININARILLCGGISSGYDASNLPAGPRNLFSLIIKRASMQGFLVLDYMSKSENAMQEIATWAMEGKIKHREDIQEGIENCPQTLNRLFTGENKGKQVLKI